MKTVDALIFELENLGFEKLNGIIPSRDLKILKNITTLIKHKSYITENQGKLLIKILKENTTALTAFVSDLVEVTTLPVWKNNFKVINKIKEISIFQENVGSFKIKIKYSFDKDVKKAISTLNKKIGAILFDSNNEHSYLLTEKNIIEIYNTLNPLKFQFSPEFLEFYKKIDQIDQDQVFENLKFDQLFETRLKKFTNFVKVEDPLLILDRKILHQYFFDHDFDEDTKKTLSYKIANRSVNKVFINQFVYSLDNILESLQQLKRSKILLIFDDYKINECTSNLQLIKSLIANHNIQQVGIYFRFDNKTDGSNFNRLVGEYAFNSKLDENTQIVGLANAKLPKFLLKNDWYPDAVISFTNNLRNNRTDTYCNSCDLIIYYANTNPMISYYDEIL